MIRIIILCVALGAAFLAPTHACADSAQDCRDLVEHAITMFKNEGREKTLSAINSRKGPLVKGDLYVFALTTTDNVMLAHPWEKTLKRIRMDHYKDSNGKSFFQQFRDVALTAGSGWVEYTWAKPEAKNASSKRAFIMKVPGEHIYVGGGYYME